MPLLRGLRLGDVVDHAHREDDVAVCVVDGVRANDRPALLSRRANAVAHEPLGRLALQRAPSRQIGGEKRRACLVEHVEARERLGAVARQELLRRGEADRAGCGVVRVDEPAVLGLHDDPLVDGPHDRLELLARLAQRDACARAHRRRCDVVCDRATEVDLAVAPFVRCVVVEHELADEPVAMDEWNEHERGDSLIADRALEVGIEAGCRELGDEHRLGVHVVRRPRRVAFGPRAVLLGEAARRVEAHDALVIA